MKFFKFYLTVTLIGAGTLTFSAGAQDDATIINQPPTLVESQPEESKTQKLRKVRRGAEVATEEKNGEKLENSR
jgi:hypothetical protein